jgi:hypothetical protein
VPGIDPVSDLLEATAVSDAQHRAEAENPPADDYDARLRACLNIVSRRGQPNFRAVLLEAHGGKCAITSCDAPAALEAAHLRPYRGPESNKISNGLPLRAPRRLPYIRDRRSRHRLPRELGQCHYQTDPFPIATPAYLLALGLRSSGSCRLPSRHPVAACSGVTYNDDHDAATVPSPSR